MSWKLVFAHPGCEKTAPGGRAIFATREEAEHELLLEAASWEDDGYLVVEFEGTFMVSKRVTPMRVTRLLVREVCS